MGTAFASESVRFIHREDRGAAVAWCRAVAESPHAAPAIVRELLLSRSVVCDVLEAEQALAWARADPPGPTIRRGCRSRTPNAG
jgi:hypothetical protein